MLETHPMVYAEIQSDGSILFHHKKPDGWRCATCDDPDCLWLSHQYFPQPMKKAEKKD